MMYGVVSAVLLYLKRWVMRRQGRVVARSAAARGVSTLVDVPADVGTSIAGVSQRE